MRVGRRALYEALSILCRCVDNKSRMNILRCVYIEASGGTLKITGTDLDRRLTLKLPCDGDLTPCCVVADLLKRTVSKDVSNGDPVDLSLHEEGRKLAVEYDGSMVKLLTSEHLDFPSERQLDLSRQFQVDKKELLDVLEYVIPAVSTDQTRLSIGVVLMDQGMIASTDGHRCHTWAIDTGLVNVRLPRNSAQLLVSMLDLGQGAVLMATALTEDKDDSTRWLNVEVFGTKGLEMIRLRTKLGDSEFPQVDQVFPKKEECRKVVLRAKELKNTVDRLRAIQKSGEVHLELGSSMKFSMSIEGDEISSEVQAVSSDFGSEQMLVGINLEYLHDAIQMADGEVELWFKSPLDVSLIEFGKAKSVVMPMRI